MRRWGLIVAAVVTFGGGARGDETRPALFPFVLPWDDASPGVTDLSGSLHRPAGKFGPVRPEFDGHLYVGERHIRFFGVNLCFAGDFPRHQDADKIAARLAKFGVNVVRFHHMDTSTFPAGIRSPRAAGTGELDPEALDRLDYLIDQLQRRGIYANLNLLVGRPFNHADGLPAEIERVDWKDRHVVGFFYEPLIKLQKDYARKLLTHRNPYTGRAYAEDPGVAFVEVNNENGLIHAWLGGQVDRLPDPFRRQLQQAWNTWLGLAYGNTAALRRAWGVKEEAPGPELLVNADFARGTEHWVLERHEGAEATADAGPDVPARMRGTGAKSVRIAVTKPGTQGWHVQFNQSGIGVRAERPYTLTFWARADRPLRINADLGEAHDPWKNLGLGANVELTTDWMEFRFTFLANASDKNARVSFTNLARQEATVWLTGVSFRAGGTVGLAANERLEDGSVPLFSPESFGSRTPEAQRHWLGFLRELEGDYWKTMRHYLKDDLKVRGVVIGTIVGCSTPNLMAQFDAVDSHAYWQHPHFPHRQWDPEDWVVPNRAMVNEAGGTLPGLALRRVVGKPHNVTEYNHSAPNTFGSEGFLLLAAYGALQDWDAIYPFAYSHRGDWDTRRITGFFDIDQHPTKMATLPAAVALFVRGDVRPAEKLVVAPLDGKREIELLRTARAWEGVHAGTAGVPRETALVHRVAILVGDRQPPRGSQTGAARPAGPRYPSDTGELLWDLSDKGRGVVTVNAPRSKAVIGYGGGKRFDLGGVVIEPGATAQDGWSTLTVTAVDGDLAGGPARLLVTATGTAENTGMKWKGPAHDSVGRDWGRAPSLVEGVPARLTLPAPAARVKAWALDERGQRGEALAVQDNGGKAAVTVGPERRTLWYEIEVK
jgi:hypothetical protein